MPTRIIDGYQIALSGEDKAITRLIWAPGEFARLRSQVEVKRCYSCDKTIVGRRIEYSETFDPWSDKPDSYPYCPECLDEGKDHEDEWYCEGCERWVYASTGYRSNIKPDPEHPDEHICVRCFQEHQIEFGHTDEQLAHRANGFCQVAMDFYFDGDLTAAGWEKVYTLYLTDLLLTKGEIWRDRCLEEKARGNLVLTDQGATGIGNAGPDWVDIWVKPDPNKEEEMDEFERWLEQVDLEVERRVGIGYEDLPDQTWRDWFDDGISPSEAAKMALAGSGWEGNEDEDEDEE